MELLKRVKIANRLTTDAYDEELEELIEEAKADLKLKGITKAEAENDPNIRKAIVTYCCIHHGQREDREMLIRIYDSIKATLGMSTGYTTWAEADMEAESASGNASENGTVIDDENGADGASGTGDGTETSDGTGTDSGTGTGADDGTGTDSGTGGTTGEGAGG